MQNFEQALFPDNFLDRCKMVINPLFPNGWIEWVKRMG